MTKFLAVVKREYLTRVRTKMFIVFTVLGPVMILLFTVGPALIASIKPNATRIAIIDRTEGGKLYERVREAILKKDDGGGEPTGAQQNANAAPEMPGRQGARVPPGATDGNFVVESAEAGGRSVE